MLSCVCVRVCVVCVRVYSGRVSSPWEDVSINPITVQPSTATATYKQHITPVRAESDHVHSGVTASTSICFDAIFDHYFFRPFPNRIAVFCTVAVVA